MSNFPKPVTSPFRSRWKWKPIIAVGSGGTALVIWFEEIYSIVTELIGLILLPILAAIIYLLNIFMFKSSKPKKDDLKK